MKTRNGTGVVCLLALIAWLIPNACAVLADSPDEQVKRATKAAGGKYSVDVTLPGEPIDFIDLDGARVTDEFLKVLAGAKLIRVLTLSNTKISNVGLRAIARLENLTSL